MNSLNRFLAPVEPIGRDDEPPSVQMRDVPLLDFGDVIKGLLAGRRFSRLSWPSNRLLFWDADRNTIYATHDLQRVRSWAWTPLNGEMTAKDWIEVIS